MGLFGPAALKDEKLIELLIEYQPIIIRSVEAYMVVRGRENSSVVDERINGLTIIENKIKESEVEIESYMSSEFPNLRRDYLYGEPYIFVTCALYYNYINKCSLKEKPDYSSKVIKLKKAILPDNNDKVRMEFIPDIIRDSCRVYLDNIESTLKKAYKSDGTISFEKKNDKEKSIAYLSEVLDVAPIIYGQKTVDDKLRKNQERIYSVINERRANMQRIMKKNKDLRNNFNI